MEIIVTKNRPDCPKVGEHVFDSAKYPSPDARLGMTGGNGQRSAPVDLCRLLKLITPKQKQLINANDRSFFRDRWV